MSLDFVVRSFDFGFVHPKLFWLRCPSSVGWLVRSVARSVDRLVGSLLMVGQLVGRLTSTLSASVQVERIPRHDVRAAVAVSIELRRLWGVVVKRTGR